MQRPIITDEKLEGVPIAVRIEGLTGVYKAFRYPDGALMMWNERTAPFIVRKVDDPCDDPS